MKKALIEQLKQQLRAAFKDIKRPDLVLAVIAGVAAWFVTLLLRATVEIIAAAK